MTPVPVLVRVAGAAAASVLDLPPTSRKDGDEGPLLN